MIRKISLFAILMTLVGALAYAQTGQKTTTKVTGFLVDNMCAAGAHDEEGAEEAAEHKVSCALMAACAKSGFAVVAKDKTYKLDAQGNKMALKTLRESKTKQGMRVQVEGTVEGDTLHADTLSEVY